MHMELLSCGDQYHDLKIVEYIGSMEIGHKHSMNLYVCECTCNTRVVLFQGEIVSGHVKDCGCKSKPRKQSLVHDLTHQKFDRLFVENQALTFWSDSGKSRMVRWNCICDCGKRVTVNSRALRIGKTRSCGCYQKERVSESLTDDLKGRKFGYLKVIERAGSRDSKGRSSGISAKWLCECRCGNRVATYGWSLKCGDNVSCGCMRVSQGEMIVKEILDCAGLSEGIDYFCEKAFPDLVSSSGGYLRFDFMVNKLDGPVFLEYQGAQHYQSVKYFGGDDGLRKRQENDAVKRRWVFDHGYELLEIPYTLRSYVDISDFLIDHHVIELIS